MNEYYVIIDTILHDVCKKKCFVRGLLSLYFRTVNDDIFFITRLKGKGMKDFSDKMSGNFPSFFPMLVAYLYDRKN